MRAIYQPRGRAAEYSPLAINVYIGCDHGCLYCYGPRVLRQSRDEYMVPKPRRGLPEVVERELPHVDPTKQILLSFIGDPYCLAEETYRLTRRVLEVLVSYSTNPVAILTKGGRRCLHDLDLFRAMADRIKIGATLVFADEADQCAWEMSTATTQERIDVLRELAHSGIRTWVSMEPVIEPEQSLELLRWIPFVPEVRLGKLNDYRGLDRGLDWARYLREALAIVGERGIVKRDLAEAARGPPPRARR